MRRAHIADPSLGPQNGYGQQQHLLEEENEEMADGLRDKVRELKDLSINIGNEVREQNKFLTDMDSTFDQSQGFLQKTMGRVRVMAQAGHGRLYFYLLGFAAFVFFLIWLILKFR